MSRPFFSDFLTEPVGLSLRNFTEPDGETASPTKNNHFFQFPNHVCHIIGLALYLLKQKYKGIKENIITCELSFTINIKTHAKVIKYLGRSSDAYKSRKRQIAKSYQWTD